MSKSCWKCWNAGTGPALAINYVQGNGFYSPFLDHYILALFSLTILAFPDFCISLQDPSVLQDGSTHISREMSGVGLVPGQGCQITVTD